MKFKLTIKKDLLSNLFKNFSKDILNTQSILAKMVLVFLLLILIPVLVIGYISTSTASSSLIKKTEDSVKMSTLQTSNYFDLYLDKIKGMRLQLITNSEVSKYYDSAAKNDLYQKIAAQKALDTFTMGITVADSSISSIGVELLLGDGQIGNSSLKLDIKKVKLTDWYKKLSSDMVGAGAMWVSNFKDLISSNSFPSDITNNASIATTYVSNYNNSSENVGLYLINLNYEIFTKNLKKDFTYLITSDGKVITSSGESEPLETQNKPFIKKVLESQKTNVENTFYFNDNNVNYLVSYLKSESTGWTSVTIMPKSEITSGADIIRNRTILIGVILGILAMIFGFIFAFRMTKNMKRLMDTMESAKNGDLTVSLCIKSKDEIGRLANTFNEMIYKIKILVEESKDAALKVGQSAESMATISRESSRASTEVAKTIEDVAAGASSQAISAESSVKNVSQLAEKINVAVTGTIKMGISSNEVKELTSNGIKTVEELNSKAHETNQITANVVLGISELNQYVKNINKITMILKGIANQTNLLALNAAIEAARAGESGKGFAVVADEVRKLAEQSNNFTKDIQDLVGKILKQAQNSTDLVQKADTSIKEQSRMVNLTAEVFSKINVSTNELGENINQMADVISDMDTYKEKVMQDIKDMSLISENTAASTEEVSATTEEQLASIIELDEMTNNLNGLALKLLSAFEKFTI